MRKALSIVLCLSAPIIGLVHAEDEVRLRHAGVLSGQVQKRPQEVDIHWPFGAVSVPLTEVERSTFVTRAAAPRRVKAWNHGTFRLSYELGREGTDVAARSVRVTVDNRQEFIDAPTPRIRAHEAMHKRINENAAARIQKELSALRLPGMSLAQGEKIFKKTFGEKVRAVNQLHADWDANDVFVSTAAAGKF